MSCESASLPWGFGLTLSTWCESGFLDPAFHFDVGPDPDPTFYFHFQRIHCERPQPTAKSWLWCRSRPCFYSDADPDPAFQIDVGPCGSGFATFVWIHSPKRPWPSVDLFWTPQLLRVDFDADPDFYSYADTDAALNWWGSVRIRNRNIGLDTLSLIHAKRQKN